VSEGFYIEEPGFENIVRIFPNPTDDAITIEYDGLGDSGQLLVFFNVFGQSVMEIALPEHQGRTQVSLKALPGGIYWYALPGTSIISGKLIINR